MNEDFTEFFRRATNGGVRYPFQKEFATVDSLPHLLHVPTGSGKTATAILGWLYRWTARSKSMPRRLVYCLPMRVLVRQTCDNAVIWLRNLGMLAGQAEFEEQNGKQRLISYKPDFNDLSKIAVHVLMGGVETEDWHLYPEQPAILIGTQDMLLSRALNRGYASSRFHWPIDFALLNNDCLWVFDEPQLMGSGVSTSAQLAGLRQALGVKSDCPSIWMSATLEPEWLDTIDFRGKFTGAPLQLTDADYDPKLPLRKRMTAAKELHKLDVDATEPKSVADAILNKLHQPGTQTLVIVNTVKSATDIYGELFKLRKKSATPELLLIHSRFRPTEREQLNKALQREVAGDRIIVATQVVEAGVDISSRTLITELAPWASIVQRIGRCNRTGDDGDPDDPANVFWIDLPDKSPPYEVDALKFARQQLEKLEGKTVSPKALDDFKQTENIRLPFEHKHVLRRRDLLDLFDTTPDLSGNDIDIQRFVRGDDPDIDVKVFWREFSAVPGDQAEPQAIELCGVSIIKFRNFIARKDRPDAFIWDHLEEQWLKLDPKQLRPGLVILLRASAGGYSRDLGWDVDCRDLVTPIPAPDSPPPPSMDSDRNTTIPIALTIAQHTKNVCAMLEQLLIPLDLPDYRKILAPAALWHDVGKAHWVCQQAQRTLNPSLPEGQLWAKTGKKGRLSYNRRHFRHELASALAALQHDLPFLAVYLIAAHHGKVRLSIRSLPGEDPKDAMTLFALGIHDGDELPEVPLDQTVVPSTKLDLSPMQLGGETSWTARALDLLKTHGPFKLAYLEAILRIADVRASRKEVTNGP